MPSWTKNSVTKADVEIFILDSLHATLPQPPFTPEETEAIANRIYSFV